MEETLVYWSTMFVFVFIVLVVGMLIEWVSRIRANSKKNSSNQQK